MLRTEIQFKINELSTGNLSRSRLNSVMSILVFKRNLLLVFLLVNTPMERHKDWRSVFHSDSSLVFTCWVCIFKVNGFKGIFFKVNVFTVNCDDVKVHHGTVTSQLIELRCLVVTSKDQIFFKFPLLFWVE